MLAQAVSAVLSRLRGAMSFPCSLGPSRARLPEVLEAIRAMPERRSLIEFLLKEAVRAAASAAVSGPPPAPVQQVDLCSLKEKLLRRAGRAAGLEGPATPGALRRLLLQAGQRGLA